MTDMPSSGIKQQAQNAQTTVKNVGESVGNFFGLNVQVVSPSQLVRDVILPDDTVKKLGAILTTLRAQIVNETLQGEGGDARLMTIVRMADQVRYLLVIPDEILAEYIQPNREALNTIRNFFQDNFPNAKIFFLHQVPPHAQFITKFPRFFAASGLILQFMSITYMDNVLEMETDQAQTLTDLLGLTPPPTIREVKANDNKQIRDVIFDLNFADKRGLSYLLNNSELDNLAVGLNLDGPANIIVSEVVIKVANAGTFEGRPGFHCLGLLLRTLCDERDIQLDNKQKLITILEECALLPPDEIQKLKT